MQAGIVATLPASPLFPYHVCPDLQVVLSQQQPPGHVVRGEGRGDPSDLENAIFGDGREGGGQPVVLCFPLTTFLICLVEEERKTVMDGKHYYSPFLNKCLLFLTLSCHFLDCDRWLL